MKDYYVSFAVKSSFNTEFKACFLSTGKKLTEQRIKDFRNKIANELQIDVSSIVILGVTLLDEIEG